MNYKCPFQLKGFYYYLNTTLLFTGFSWFLLMPWQDLFSKKEDAHPQSNRRHAVRWQVAVQEAAFPSFPYPCTTQDMWQMKQDGRVALVPSSVLYLLILSPPEGPLSHTSAKRHAGAGIPARLPGMPGIWLEMETRTPKTHKEKGRDRRKWPRLQKAGA